MKIKIALFLFLIPSFVFSQISLDYYLPKNVSYNSKIPTPKAFLGYEVGEQHVSPYEIYAYYREVAKYSDRIKSEWNT
jgi:hypothetical protein